MAGGEQLLLLSRGADINKESGDDTPLDYAISGYAMSHQEHGRDEVINLLMDGGATINTKSTATTLHTAIMYSNHEGILKLLLAKRADVDAKTSKDGETPLHLAASKGKVAAVKLLLAHGADVNAREALCLCFR
ncbi:MAG TPA: ankyrin repeat domain-containing protein [Stellaceae bacterium]|nr:ankyrin repeat domain-containing protein [Stellaceae bacterium]